MFALVLMLVMTLVPVVAFAAEAVAEDGFSVDSLVIGDVALALIISIASSKSEQVSILNTFR